MKILHVTSHLGGGVGTVIMGWMDRVIAANDHSHRIICLDYANDKTKAWMDKTGFYLADNMGPYLRLFEHEIADADIVLCHYWDHHLIDELFSDPIPPCRLVFWSHKNHPVPQQVLSFPDLFLDVSPVQGHGRYIWSTGGVDRFLKIKPQAHEGFNIGTVATYIGNIPKLHPDFTDMCGIIKHQIPEARFTILGDWKEAKVQDPSFNYVGHVDDVAPYLAEFDVFGYPLRPDHWGTCEQVLGEAMAAGVVPVVMNNPAESMIVGLDGWVAADSPQMDYVECMTHYYYDSPRDILKKQVRERAKVIYSLDAMIQKWDEVFAEMMEKPKTVRHTL